VLSARGQRVPLDAKAFDLLELLATRPGEALSVDDILAHVWRGRVVGENNVKVQMSALRRVLAEHGDGGQSIVTLPDQRYRFVGGAPVPDTSSQAAPPTIAQGRRPWVWRGAVFATVLVVAGVLLLAFWRPQAPAEPELSIVVLPFRNLSPDKSLDFLPDAVTDDLTTELTRIPGSVVIARSSANPYAGRDMAAIRQDLHVRYVLEGGVQPEAATLRINVRLVDAVTGQTIWSKTFQVPRDHVGDAPDLIVDRAMAALDLALVRAESGRSRKDRPQDPGTLDLFFQARSILDQGTSLADYQAAQALLESAIAARPDFTDALAELGWLLVCKVTDVDDPQQVKDEARAGEVIAGALKLTPQHTLALAAQGRLYSIQGDYAAAIASASAALAIEPGDPDAQWVLATAEFYLGHLDEAVIPLRAGLRVDPEGPSSKQRYTRLGSISLFEGDYPGAIKLLESAAAGDVLPEPGTGAWSAVERTRLYLIAANQLNKDFQTASALYADYKIRWLHRTVWRIGNLPPKNLFRLRGFQDFLDALEQAGMPRFADERASDNISISEQPLSGGDFSPTPTGIRGASTIDTNAMVKLVSGSGPKLIIDLGAGTSVIEGAQWIKPARRDIGSDPYVDQILGSFREKYRNAPVVVMGDGTYGIRSYNAAIRLASLGMSDLYWYRGGEEAWAKAGLPGTYQRPD
jgi:TolB-like protein/DNA-binding winged helix-turn-helix (wHTH) protein/tetratricopeptide (TPR) repeat protein